MNENSLLRVMAKPAFKNAAKNPYNSLLYSTVTALGVEVAEFSPEALSSASWDILHIHWPESLLERRNRASAWWSARKNLAMIDRARRNGVKIVWTVHDLKPHDVRYAALELDFWLEVMRRVDAVIGLTEGGLRLAREQLPELNDKPAFIVPHGHYRSCYPRTFDQGSARRDLGLADNAAVITYFGQIRPYKNVPLLIRVFREIARSQDALFVCGRLNRHAPVASDIRSASSNDPRVRLVLRAVGVDEVQIYLVAADLLVFPYTDILNSGSALLGLSFDRPVLVPNRGAMTELRDSVGEEWVRTYDGELDRDVLDQALNWAKAARRNETAPLEEFDWPAIGRRMVGAYRAVVNHHPDLGN